MSDGGAAAQRADRVIPNGPRSGLPFWRRTTSDSATPQRSFDNVETSIAGVRSFTIDPREMCKDIRRKEEGEAHQLGQTRRVIVGPATT